MHVARFYLEPEDVPIMDSAPFEGEVLDLSDDDPIVVHDLGHGDHTHVWVKWSRVTLGQELVVLN